MSSIFDPPNPSNNILAQLLAEYEPPRLGGLLGLGGAAPSLAENYLSGLGGLLSSFAISTGARTRTEWNNRFDHWKKHAAVTEEGTIDRAEANARAALGESEWLVGQKVALSQQGSYFNNTNVRTEADIDLRLEHPLLRIDHEPGITASWADAALQYSYPGPSLESIFATMRSHAVYYLGQKFGRSHVDATGNKAIRVKGITGSRAELDLVPTVGYHRVSWSSALSVYQTTVGVAILGQDGSWTYNYPEQHHTNGKAKRTRTARRFKGMVRIFKRLRSDLPNADGLNVPSFLVECLVHMVEDEHFLFEDDDHYDRVRRILIRMRDLVKNPLLSIGLREINGIKPLFDSGQAWTRADAIKFVDAVADRLGVA